MYTAMVSIKTHRQIHVSRNKSRLSGISGESVRNAFRGECLQVHFCRGLVVLVLSVCVALTFSFLAKTAAAYKVDGLAR